MERKEVLLFDDEAWTLCIISDTSVQRPVTWRDTARCVSLYLSRGNGSLTRRLISVLRRVFTCSLKPSKI